MKKVSVLMALAVAGCQSTSKSFDAVFPSYEGKPIEMVLSRWGPPQERLEFYDGTVFYWSGSATYQPVSPQTTTGYIGRTPFVLNAPAPPMTLSCRVEVHTDRNNLLIGMWWKGNEGACQDWMNRLR
jgi:hypothetical protein